MASPPLLSPLAYRLALGELAHTSGLSLGAVGRAVLAVALSYPDDLAGALAGAVEASRHDARLTADQAGRIATGRGRRHARRSRG